MSETAHRSARVKSLFETAVELDPAERSDYLLRTEEETALRKEVEKLLLLDGKPSPELDESAPRAFSMTSETNILIGRRVGSYLLERCLAVGGMGVVYAALQENPQRTVAVKLLRSDLATDELRHRFRVESRFLAQLQHPGIAHIYEADVAQIDGVSVPYMAMELVPDARSITAYADESSLPIEARLELFVRVCAAVHHGHLRGVIHRDLKPANILIDRNGRPKLIDFGIARTVDPETATRHTDAGVLLGTLQYMSPEQCTEPGNIDVRSDVYSLGVVLFELLCGKPPYDLTQLPLPEAARVIQESTPRSPALLSSALRGDMETVLLKALEKDRSRRYQSAAELGADLRRFLSKEPVAARPQSALYRVGLFARRHKWMASSLLTIFLVSVLAAVISTSFALRERRARERGEVAAYLANVSAADASLRVFDVSGARRRLLQAPVERRGWEWAHLAARLECATRVVAGLLPRCKGVVWRDGRIYSIWEDTTPEVRVGVWDTQSADWSARAGPFPGGAAGIAVTADGRVVWVPYGTDSDMQLHCWDPESGSLEVFPAGHTGRVKGVHVAADGTIFTASLDGTVRLCSVGDLETVRVLGTGSVPWYSLAVSPDGERVAVGGADGTVHVLETAGGTGIVLAGHELEVGAVAFHPSGALLASGAQDGTIRIWDLATESTLEHLHGHQSEVRALVFLGDLLLSASNDGTIRTWNLVSGAPENVLYGHEKWVTGLDASADGRQVVSGAFDGSLRIWDPFVTPGVKSIGQHTQIVRDLAFSPDGRFMATASLDGLAKLFDPQGMLELETLNGCGGRVSSVAFQPGEGLLATGSADPAVRLWRPDSGELLRELDGHEQGVSDVAFSSDGELLASSSSDGRVIVRETGDFERVATLEHGAAIRRIAFHPVADRIATVDNSNTLRLWDARSGSEIWRRVSPASLHSVEFSPDGRRLATGEGDFNGERVGIGLWSAATGEALRTLQGHTEVVYDVRFSPDGSRLASASADGTVRLWDPERAIELLALTGHESWVFCVAFSPDGYLLASGGGNYGGVGAGVRVWDSR